MRYFLSKASFRLSRLHLHSVRNYSKCQCQLVEGTVYRLSCKGGTVWSPLPQAAPTSCTYTGPHSRPNLCLACCVCLWEPQDLASICLLWNLGQSHSSLKMNQQQVSRFFAAPIYPMCRCKDVVGLMPLGPQHFYCKSGWDLLEPSNLCWCPAMLLHFKPQD